MSASITHSHSYLVSLPQIVEADDYHEFATMAETLNQVFDEEIKVEEIGFNYQTGKYEGLSFCGRSAKRIKARRYKELQELEQVHDAEVDFQAFRAGSSTTEALIDFIESRSGFDALAKDCKHDRECVKVVHQMQEHLALGTARRTARAFLEPYCSWD